MTPRPNLSAASDQELVALARQGREDAYTELVRRYQRPVLALIYRMIGRREPAEDLTQETLFKAVKGFGRHPPEHNLSGWMLSIAHNTAADYVRLKRLDTVPLDDSPEVTPPRGHKVPPIQVARWASAPAGGYERELDTAIEQAIGGLKDDYRRVVMLRFVEDRSYENIAEILGVSVATVGIYLHRARKQLKKTLGPMLARALNNSPPTMPLR